MGNPFHEKAKEFWSGFSLGGIAGIKFLWVGGNNWPDIAFVWVLKFFGTCMLAFSTGILTIVATDFYKHYLKNKLFPHGKDKNNKDDKDQENEKAA